MKNNTASLRLLVVLFLLPFFVSAQSFSSHNLGQNPKENSSFPKPSAPLVVGTIVGQVTDCNTSIGISNVAVVADNGVDVFETETDQNGNYTLTVDTATYELSFVLLGFKTETQSGIVVSEGNTITADESLCEMPYPVSNVYADPNEADTQVVITWDMPKGPYTIIQDDGSAEDFSVWAQAGGAVAVKFSPIGYPATVTGGKLFVGDGSFPAGGDWLGDDVAVGVADDDGINGMPGTITDSVIVSVDEYGWLEFPDVFDSEFNEGDFYIVMWQLGNSPDAVPIGVDTDQPTVFNSYSKMPNGDWGSSPYQDYMIRVEVSGPTNSVNLNSIRDLNKYNQFRMSGFDPDAGEGPEDGVPTGTGSTSSLSKNDTQFGSQPAGFYGYAIEAQYDSGDKSDWAYSNIVAHLLDNVVTVTVTQCDGGEPSDVVVTLNGFNYPYQQLIDTTEPDGIAVFDSVIDGHYDITIEKVGYQNINLLNVEIYDDYNLSMPLQENVFPARNLYVDPLTSVAIWDEALIQPLPLEDFEDEVFPPEGWEIVQTDTLYYPETWERVNGPYYNWYIPPQNDDGSYSEFAAINEQETGIAAENADWLITPIVDLRQSDSFKLIYDQYYDDLFGSSFTNIKYSTDSGETWAVLSAVVPCSGYNWKSIEIDLSFLSGIQANNQYVKFAFVVKKNNLGRSKWAIDNVRVSNGPAPIYGYYVYLDDKFMALTTPEVRTFTFEDLEYGKEYYAKVRALYSCGLSVGSDYIWNSTYLYPPRNLSDDYIYNTNEVPIIWNPPVNANGDSVPDGVLSFNIYRNGDSLTNIVYDSLVPPDFDFIFVDTALNPGTYIYDISAIYDLSVFDTTLQSTDESMLTETVTVEVVWGMDLPFIEDWAQNSFEFQQWETNGTNWVINSSIGNDAPSAEFSWEPQLEEEYSVSLTSNWIRADSLSEGEIFLDFDLKLEDRNSTSLEQLWIEVKTAEGEWESVEMFTNHHSFDFESMHFSITRDVKGEVFKIRFRAAGQNSYDIIGWYIDNINIYRECMTPYDLTGEYVWNSEDDLGVEVCWDIDAWGPPALHWLTWDSYNNMGGIGLTEEGPFSCAARWDAGMLVEYDGTYITKVRFFPSDHGFSTITVKVWYGPNASTLVAEKEVSVNDVTIGMYNEVILDDPIEIDASQELWVGYTIVQVGTGVFPAGHDEGPAVVGYGDKVSLDGTTWDNLSDFGPDFNVNWNIQFFPEEISTVQKPMVELNNSGFINATSSSLISKKRKESIKINTAKDRGFSGFNLYRKQEGFDYELYADIPKVEGQLSYCFWDAFPAVNIYESYSYKVTAVYESEIDNCESAFARAYNSPDDDFVEIIVTDIKNPANGTIKIYPNPAKDYLNIQSSFPISHIEVYNNLGQLVFVSEIAETTNLTFNTAAYENGVYILKIITSQGIVNQRIVLAN